uniref:Uncharacterized protein n=1 Tax=Tetradesmus obliquus TaxID=3088 RepID=A0A383V4C6_TETOB
MGICSSSPKRLAGPGDKANRAAARQQLGSSQQLALQLSQPLPKQAFYNSGGSLLSSSSKVLQQLRATIDERGIYASLPTTVASFNPATAQTLLNSSELH